MIAPGTDGVQIVHQHGPVQARFHFFPRQFCGEIHAERLRHVERHQHGVHGLPGPRPVVQQAELRRKVIVRLRDIVVYPARVVVEETALVRWHCGQGGAGGVADFENPLRTIMFDGFRPQNLG